MVALHVLVKFFEMICEVAHLRMCTPIDSSRDTALHNIALARIREERPPKVGGAEGRAAVELCEACLISARTGEAVSLPL